MARYLTTVLLALGLALGMAQEQQQPVQGQTIRDYLQGADDLLTMRAAVNADQQLSQTLSGEGTYTLFAPNNQAFSVITEEQLNQIMSGQSGLGHYVVRGTLTPEVLQGMLQARGGQMSLQTEGGSSLSFTLDDQGTITVGGVAQIGEPRVLANGVVVPINNIIAAQPGQDGQQQAGQDGQQQEGQQQEGQQAEAPEGQQQTGDQVAGGGQAGGQGEFTGQSIADVLQDTAELEALRAAMNADQQLSQTLSGEGMFTLFAPTNDAFSLLAQEQFDAIMGGQGNLQQYVVEGATLTTDVLRGLLEANGGQLNLPTMGGGNLSFTLDDQGGIVVGGVARIAASQITGNGVVQQIDNVVATTPGQEGQQQEGGVAGGGAGQQTEGQQTEGQPTDAGQPQDQPQQDGQPADPGQQQDGQQQEGQQEGGVEGGAEGQQASQQLLSTLQQAQQFLQDQDVQGAQQQLDQAQQQVQQAMGQAQEGMQAQLQEVQTLIEQAQQALQNDEIQGAQQSIDQAMQQLQGSQQQEGQ